MTVSQEQQRQWQDAQTLKTLADQGMSQGEMADRLGCSQATISDWLDRHGIEHDVRSERSGTSRSGVGLELHQPNQYSQMYVRWKAWDVTSDAYVYVHRLLAVAEYGFDAVGDKQVHHCNGIAWDNRPENLEVLDPGEHQKGHGKWGRLA